MPNRHWLDQAEVTQSRQRRDRFLAISSLLLALVMVLSACTASYRSKPTGDETAPSQATFGSSAKAREIERIFDHLNHRRWTALKDILAFQTTTPVSIADIQARQERVYKTLGVTSMALTDIAKIERASDDEIMVYQATMALKTAYGPMNRPLRLTFLYNSKTKAMELDYSPSLLFPGLTDDNDIVVRTREGQRGSIYDRAHRPLATNGKVKTVGLVAGSFRPEDSAAVAALLGIDVKVITDALNQPWVKKGLFVPVVTVPSLTTEQIQALPRYGMTTQETTSRLYPLGAAAAHLVGYVGAVTRDDIAREPSYYHSDDEIGKRGLEALFEKRLRPHRGISVVLTGQTPTVLYETPSGDGEDIVLTLDSALQTTVYNVMKDDEGQAVAIDPKTGDVLALVSLPSFDPNAFVRGMPSATYRALLDDVRAPLFNRFPERYAPGSTAKIMSFVAGYNLGLINDATRKTIVGKTWRPDASWGGYGVTRYEVYDKPQSPADAIAHSDNIFFAQVALAAGADRWITMWRQAFAIGEDVPIDYPFSRAQFSNDGSLKNPVLLADTAFGQGEFQITALQLTAIASAVITGDLMAPRLLSSAPVKAWRNGIASSSTRSSLIQALRLAVTTTHQGTVDRPYTALCGKSGTVQTGHDSRSNQEGIDSWFVGFDTDHPSFVLTLQLQNTQRRTDEMTAPRRFGQVIDAIYGSAHTPYTPPAVVS